MFLLSSTFLSTIGKVSIWNVRKTAEPSWLPKYQVGTPWDGQIFADHDRASSDGVQPQENVSLQNAESCVEWSPMLKMADEINEEVISEDACTATNESTNENDTGDVIQMLQGTVIAEGTERDTLTKDDDFSNDIPPKFDNIIFSDCDVENGIIALMLEVNQLVVVASAIKSMVKALDDPVIIEDQKEEVSEWKHMTMKYPISCQMMKGLSHVAENLDDHSYVAEKLWDPGGLLEGKPHFKRSGVSWYEPPSGLPFANGPVGQWAGWESSCAGHKEEDAGTENRGIEQNRDFRRWPSSSSISSLNPFLCLLFPLLYL
jgi:hypothetical protein